MIIDIEKLVESNHQNGATSELSRGSTQSTHGRTVMQELGVPFVREILIHHDGHERHKI